MDYANATLNRDHMEQLRLVYTECLLIGSVRRVTLVSHDYRNNRAHASYHTPIPSHIVKDLITEGFTFKEPISAYSPLSTGGMCYSVHAPLYDKALELLRLKFIDTQTQED